MTLWMQESPRLQAGEDVKSRAVPVKCFLVHNRQKPYVDQIQSFLVQQTDVAKIGITDGFIGFDQSLLIKAGEWLSAGAV